MHKCVLGSFSKLTTSPRNAAPLVMYRYLLMPPRNSLNFFQTEQKVDKLECLVIVQSVLERIVTLQWYKISAFIFMEIRKKP